jgi:hypothetical protein
MSDTNVLSRTPAEQRTYDYYGGMFLAVVGGILLVTSFMVRNPVPLTVRGAIVLFMAAGIAVTMRLIQVKNQQDFYGGMGLIFLALVAFVASNDLPGMRILPDRAEHGGRHHGPDYPRPLCDEV